MIEATPTPIADGIPTDKAWKIGRRIYIRCGYQSTLNDELRDIGATWDKDVKALYVGTGKLALVLPLIQAQVARIEAVETVKAAGHRIAIPFDATTIRTQAKAGGGVWDANSKTWLMPTPEALATVQQAVTAWTEARRAARAVATQATAADAATSSQDREARLIATSGRTPTDRRGTASGRLSGRMVRAQAEQAKPQPGTVLTLDDGERVLVLTSITEFWSRDDVYNSDDDGDPGWRYQVSYVAVEPTAAEAAADAAERAERADHDEIAAVMTAADRTPRTRRDSWTGAEGATVTERSAGGMSVHGGQIIVTATGEVYYRHPGWYDDYVRTEAVIADVDLIARILAVIAGGPRRRGRYEVKQ